jgi:hypothetical protein
MQQDRRREREDQRPFRGQEIGPPVGRDVETGHGGKD